MKQRRSRKQLSAPALRGGFALAQDERAPVQRTGIGRLSVRDRRVHSSGQRTADPAESPTCVRACRLARAGWACTPGQRSRVAPEHPRVRPGVRGLPCRLAVPVAVMPHTSGARNALTKVRGGETRTMGASEVRTEAGSACVERWSRTKLASSSFVLRASPVVPSNDPRGELVPPDTVSTSVT